MNRRLRWIPLLLVTLAVVALCLRCERDGTAIVSAWDYPEQGAALEPGDTSHLPAGVDSTAMGRGPK